MKTNCGAKWFIDGENYFGYLLEQLRSAKESVFITDWFMSPELALKRPINYNDFIELLHLFDITYPVEKIFKIYIENIERIIKINKRATTNKKTNRKRN